ncbi:MAG: hypothetical protein K2X27_00595 [Candidatus Obscuribacterales bacterium]|nr:hypothetical protein [Candidatus Obscuribacterales bacterium]
MILIEIIVLLVVASVLVTIITAVGRPVAETLALKTRYKIKEIDSAAESRLLKRIEGLEEELRQTQGELRELKSSTEFSLKMLEDSSKKSGSA